MRLAFLKIFMSRWSLLFPLPLWALVILLIFLNNQKVLNEAGYEMARQRGEVAFTLIQTMRSWNTGHGGIYALLTEATPENPYLEVPEKTIESQSGRLLTMVNPAYMTRQIADLMRGSDLEISLTSDRLMNPNNKPDDWEAKVIKYLTSTGAAEYVEQIDGRFRYMAPLFIQQGCMACHGHMGYQVGDLRGGLSVSFPESYIELLTQDLHRESRLNHLVAFLLLSAISSIALFGLRSLLISLFHERQLREALIHERTASLNEEVRRSKAAQEKLSFLAHHDELTGARNRRWILSKLEQLLLCQNQLEASSIALLMLDIDHFKRINDTFGHEAGDDVLRGVVQTLHEHLRESDQLGRYGGEEFLVLLPDSSRDKAMKLAERLRIAVEDSCYTLASGEKLKITTSIGISLSSASITTPEGLVNCADMALYQAKSLGRNRCVLKDA